jgi:hypothetical protein
MDSRFHRTGNIGNEMIFEKTMCEIKKGIKNESGVIRSFLFAKTKCRQSVVKNVLQRDFNLYIYKIKKPILFDRLCVRGGERGIRTPVPVFAGNMISNHAP